jgi:ABC-type transport system involved in multi-copper enzyme maturation permease subunit
VNPVLQLELRRRWRGRRAALTLGAFLLTLAALMYALHEVGRRVLEQQSGFGGGVLGLSQPSLGRFMVESVLALLLVMVLLAAPAFAAGQIAGERERRTLPLLQATLMRPSSIAFGKLAASTAWVGVLVVAALPLVAISAAFGGVEPLDVVLGLACVVVLGLCLAAVSLGVSAVVRRTVAAVVISYAIVLLLVVATGFVALVIGVVQRSADAALWPLYANPFVPLAGAVNSSLPTGFLSLPTPLTPFVAVLRYDALEAGGLDVVSRTWSWLWSIALYAVFGAAGFLVATRRLSTTRRLPSTTPGGTFPEAPSAPHTAGGPDG